MDSKDMDTKFNVPKTLAHILSRNHPPGPTLPITETVGPTQAPTCIWIPVKGYKPHLPKQSESTHAPTGSTPSAKSSARAPNGSAHAPSNLWAHTRAPVHLPNRSQAPGHAPTRAPPRAPVLPVKRAPNHAPGAPVNVPNSRIPVTAPTKAPAKGVVAAPAKGLRAISRTVYYNYRPKRRESWPSKSQVSGSVSLHNSPISHQLV